MDFFNIPSELSKANSPAYKSGLLKLYAKGGFTGRSDYKRSIENDIRVGMYDDGGPVRPIVAVNPDYDLTQAPKEGNYLLPDINRPYYVDAEGNKRSEYKMGVSLNGKETLIPTVVNGKQLSGEQAIQRYYDTGLHMGQFDTIKDAEYESMLRTKRYNVLRDAVRSSPELEKFAEGGEMEETGVSPKPFNPPKKNIRKVPFPSTETEFMNTYGTMVKLPENFDSILKYYSSSRRPSHLEVYEQDCIAAGTCGPNTKTFINPIFTTIVPPITTPPKPPIPKPPIPKPPKPTPPEVAPPKPTPPLPNPVDTPVPVKEVEKSKEIVSPTGTNPISPRMTGVPSNEVYYLDSGATPIDPRTGKLNLKRLYNPGNYAGQRYDKEGNKINAQGVRMGNGGLLAFNEGGEMDDDPTKPVSPFLPKPRVQPVSSELNQFLQTTNASLEKKQQAEREQKLAQQLAAEYARRSNTTESTRTTPQNFTPQQRATAIPRQSNVVGALDIASDIMRFGKYIPHPVAQAIGNAGTLLGNGIDMYQGINYLNQGNYKDAAANAIMSRVGKTSGLGAGFELAHDISNYEKGGLQLFGKGGYRVVRTSERKGKTHKVIGPGGKVKYFGDPSMGERSKSKYGKEAFYKRHAKNLKANPYFRAYARATWSEGGIVRDVEPFNLSSY